MVVYLVDVVTLDQGSFYPIMSCDKKVMKFRFVLIVYIAKNMR